MSEEDPRTEYYDRFDEPNGDQWFTVTTVVADPVYLSIPFVTTTDFKKRRLEIQPVVLLCALKRHLACRSVG